MQASACFGPAIEQSGLWGDFHHVFLATLRERLSRLLPARYVTTIDERVYVAWEDPPLPPYRPDLTVTAQERGGLYREGVSPFVACTLPVPDPVTEPFLEVRTVEGELVAVVELLSPNNKKPGHDGREAYLSKRRKILQSSVHLIEMDLLLGGQRMPLADDWPAGDYHILVARGDRCPAAEVYSWRAGEALPVIAFPLLPPDPDARLELQPVFETTWERGDYERLLTRARRLPHA